MSATKAELRRELRAQRRALTPDQRSARSEAAALRLLEHVSLAGLRAIAAYDALDDEADPSLFVARAREAGATVLFPRVEGDELAVAPAPLVPGTFGVREPSGPAIPLDSVDLVVVPGLAFDTDGRRLGYGRGFYDRALARLDPERTRTVAFAFDLQLIARVPSTDRDVPVDAIVTEARWLSRRWAPM